MQIEFACTRCALNANWIHIDHIHTAKTLELNIVTNCCWWATPTAAQVTISTLALSSQHSRCIETHTKVHPIICLTLLLVVDSVECDFRQTTRDHLVSGLISSSLYHPSLIGHRSSYLGRQIQYVLWLRCESFDNVAVHGGITVMILSLFDE